MNRYAAIALLAVLALTGCVNADEGQGGGGKSAHAKSSETGSNHSVNGSINVAADQKKDDASTVNGSIKIADGGAVATADTVNGSIDLGAQAKADELHTVNGAITLGDGASVARSITAVNGKLTLHSGSDVGGGVSNVNGQISLQSAHVGGLIKTVSGNIDIGANSHADGGLLVEKENTDVFWFFHWNSGDIPDITIGAGAVVQGTLRFERKVRLYVNDTATIGQVIGATPIKFSGDRPPKD
jgi:DUF4097 and DUF4098 domain-containing protein YvlB